MLIASVRAGCSGSSVVAEAREILRVCRNRRRTLLGRFPTADFVFTPYGRVVGNSCLAPGNGKLSSPLPSPQSTRHGSLPAPGGSLRDTRAFGRSDSSAAMVSGEGFTMRRSPAT